MNKVKISRPKTKQHGFTLIELLVSMAIFGILMLAFTQIFGGSLRASSEINSRNELISEGQIAQQLVASRLQSAYYIYKRGQTMQLTGRGTTTVNNVGGGGSQNWTVGTQPFVAMILPPKKSGSCPSSPPGDPDACFTFYAYYPAVRGTFISSNSSSAPPNDPANTNVWFLMEYRANLYDGVNRTANRLSSPPNTTTILTNPAAVHPNIKGNSGRILVDFVQPTTNIPTYIMFNVCKPADSTTLSCPTGTTVDSPIQVDFNLRFLKNRGGKTLTAPSGTAPLSTHIYPRNLQ